MKSQRRHELHTNELAEALGRLLTRAREHANALAIGAGLVVIAIVVLVWIPSMRRRAEWAAQSAFAQALEAPGTEPLEHFLEQYPDATPTPAARLALADRLLASVAAGTADDADALQARLAEAEGLYNDVAAADPALLPFARTGLALVVLQRGDLDQGRTLLKEVVEKWPDSVAAARAKVHLGLLADYSPVAFSNEPLEPTPPETGDPAETPKTETPASEASKTKAPKTEPPPSTTPAVPPAEHPPAPKAEAPETPVPPAETPAPVPAEPATPKG